MKRILCLLIAHLSILCISQTVFTLSGQIQNEKNEPIKNVLIEITNHPELSTFSDNNGNYKIIFKSTGSYELRLTESTVKTEIIDVLIDNTYQSRDIILYDKDVNIKTLDNLIITSSRMKEKKDEVPSSISVLSSRDIDIYKSYSNIISDVVSRVPGFSLSTNRQQTRGQYLRGRNVLIMIDGIPQSSPLFVTGEINLLDPSVVERIEIIKGATSIYGNGAEGGIVNYITKRNKTDQHLESKTRVGTSVSLVSPDHSAGIDLSQYFSGKVNNLSYVVGASYKQFGIMKDNDGVILSPRDGLGEMNFYNIFSKVGYNFNNGYEASLMYNFFQNQQKTQLLEVPGKYGESPAIGIFGKDKLAIVDRGVKYNHNIKLEVAKDELFNNTRFDVSIYYQDYKTIYDFFNYFADITKGLQGGQPGVTTNQKGLRVNLNTSYFTNNVSGNIFYGIDLLNNKTAQPMADGRIFAPEMNMNNYAAYLQTKANFSDIIFKGGGRFEKIAIRVDDYKTLYRNNGKTSGGGLNVKGGKLSYDAFTYNLGLRYNKSSYVQPYASLSQAFSVGELGRILRTATDSSILTNKIKDTKAIITNNFEIGLAGRLSNNLRYNANYFYNTSKLGTTYVEKQDGFFELERLPEKIKGFEAEIDLIINRLLDFNFSVSTLEGRVSNDVNSQERYITGLRISPSIFRGTINYRPVPNWNISLINTFMGSRDRFKKNDKGTYAFGEAPVKSNYVANLSTTYMFSKDIEMTLGIENIFNSSYYPAYSQYSGRDTDYIKGNGINAKLAVIIKL